MCIPYFIVSFLFIANRIVTLFIRIVHRIPTKLYTGKEKDACTMTDPTAMARTPFVHTNRGSFLQHFLNNLLQRIR